MLTEPVVTTLMGAVVGAITAGLVAWLLDRDRRKSVRKEDRRILAAALDVEVEMLIIAIEGARDQEDPLIAMTVLPKFRHSTHVYLGSIEKIGILGKKNVRSIVAAYSHVLLWMNVGDDILKQIIEFHHHEETNGERTVLIMRLREEAIYHHNNFGEWIENAKQLKKDLGEIAHLS